MIMWSHIDREFKIMPTRRTYGDQLIGYGVDLQLSSSEIEATTSFWKVASRANPAKERKRVRFSDTPEVRYTVTRQELLEDFPLIFYTRDDYRYMKTYSLKLAQHLEELGEYSDTAEDSFRGLESLTKVEARKRDDRKRQGRTSVLDEQDRQRRVGIRNQEAISAVYLTAASINSNDQAIARGFSDAMAVREMVEESGEWLESTIDLSGILSETTTHNRQQKQQQEELKQQQQERKSAGSPYKWSSNLMAGLVGWRKTEEKRELRI